jgi:pheromone a factor receptor
MCTNYIIQTSRYVIIKYRGCTVTYALSPVSIVLYSMWNIIWAAVAVVFSVLTLVTYFRKRKDVKDILRCTNSGLNLKGLQGY